VEATRLALQAEADTLVGIGGSTISDAARMIAVMMADEIISEDRLRELGQQQQGLLSPKLGGNRLPWQVSIPTTLSAGEFNTGGGNILDDRVFTKCWWRVSMSLGSVSWPSMEESCGAATPMWLVAFSP